MKNLKTCSICLDAIDTQKFYKWRSVCIKCYSEQRRQSRIDHPEKVRKITSVERSILWNAYHDKNKTRIREIRRKYKEEHRNQIRAWRSIRQKIHRGLLSRPSRCGACGRIGKVEASHNDYNKRFDIEWLCVTCHRRKDSPLKKKGW